MVVPVTFEVAAKSNRKRVKAGVAAVVRPFLLVGVPDIA